MGIDAGITSLVTLSTGEKITNPRHERRDRARLAKAQRALSRKQKGSANRARARVKVARVACPDHRPAPGRAPQAIDSAHPRDPNGRSSRTCPVRNMVRNHCLARAISDAAWAELRRQLEYKADWYGRTVIAVDRFYPSSKTCSACGVITAKMPLNIREWMCAACGVRPTTGT